MTRAKIRKPKGNPLTLISLLFSLFAGKCLCGSRKTLIFTAMKDKHIPFIYSDTFTQISSPQYRGWIIHLLCLNGEGSLIFNRKFVRVKRNDALILTRTDLASDIVCGKGLETVFIAAPARFLYSLLPANHYGIGGGISLFDNPVMPLSETEASVLRNDLEQIRLRMNETSHRFYTELMGSLALTMMYDLFDFHARLHATASSGGQTPTLMKRLIGLLEQGTCKTHRTVSYYADCLHVSPKYLSETVKRITGYGMMRLIDQYTLPIVIGLLKNSNLSLTQLSEEMNFTSPSYFTRYVQKHLGMSPGEYRKSLLPVKEER